MRGTSKATTRPICSHAPRCTRWIGSDSAAHRARAVYRAGDAIDLRVFSTKQRGTAYIDVVKDGQTVLTRDVDIVNGQAQLALTATPDLAGKLTLDFNAYLFGADARPAGDHRLVFVQPADELKFEASANAASYKPGDDAQVRFRVTNSRGEGRAGGAGIASGRRGCLRAGGKAARLRQGVLLSGAGSDEAAI